MKKKAKSRKAKPAKKAKKTVRKAAKPARKKASKKSAKAARSKSKTKKAVAPAPQAPKPGIIPPANGVEIGRVDDFYAHISVIALTLQKDLATGNRIQILGHTTSFEQTVDSMQINHQPVSQAAAGQGVGIKVNQRARKGDHVFLLS